MIRAPLSLLALTLLACTDGSDTGDDWNPESFTGGNFQFTSTDVDDSCLDGAFVALFLPEGAGTQSDWQYPIELPAWSALPATLDVQLQEPFSTTEVTMTAGDTNGTITIAGVPQTDVEYDSANSPGCLVNMSVNVEVVIDDDTHIHGNASMETSSFDEDNCPAVEADPCQINLTFIGEAI